MKKFITTVLTSTMAACISMTSGAMNASATNIHTVEAGDTLYYLACIYDTDVASIQEANGMEANDYSIPIGKDIIIPDQEDDSVILHTVEEYDTLYKLSKIYDVEVTEIQEANGMEADDYSISLGTEIIIPVNSNNSTKKDDEKLEVTTTAKETPTIITTTAAINTTSENTTVNTVKSDKHVVTKGETLSSIARKFRITIDGILKLNPQIKNPDLIFSGDTLNIHEIENNTVKVENNKVEDSKVELPEVSTPEVSTPSIPEVKNNLPDEILSVLKEQKRKYPGLEVGIGIYKGGNAYVYNQNSRISAACTVKAAYALFVLTECEKQGIDIYNTKLTYKIWMRNDGSGVIKNDPFGSQYTIDYLVKKLLQVSDNTAYNILTSKFSLIEFQKFLNKIDGQQMWGCQYGAATVTQRANEWFAIVEYTKSGSKYSNVLYNYLNIAQYGYIEQGMSGNHTVLHKSGWCDGTYTSASDCAWVDGEYLVVILTQDYSTGKAHADVLRALGGAIEDYFG